MAVLSFGERLRPQRKDVRGNSQKALLVLYSLGCSRSCHELLAPTFELAMWTEISFLDFVSMFEAGPKPNSRPTSCMPCRPATPNCFWICLAQSSIDSSVASLFLESTLSFGLVLREIVGRPVSSLMRHTWWANGQSYIEPCFCPKCCFLSRRSLGSILILGTKPHLHFRSGRTPFRTAQETQRNVSIRL